jgi:hypothetical protein
MFASIRRLVESSVVYLARIVEAQVVLANVALVVATVVQLEMIVALDIRLVRMISNMNS